MNGKTFQGFLERKGGKEDFESRRKCREKERGYYFKCGAGEQTPSFQCPQYSRWAGT